MSLLLAVGLVVVITFLDHRLTHFESLDQAILDVVVILVAVVVDGKVTGLVDDDEEDQLQSVPHGHDSVFDRVVSVVFGIVGLRSSALVYWQIIELVFLDVEVDFVDVLHLVFIESFEVMTCFPVFFVLEVLVDALKDVDSKFDDFASIKVLLVDLLEAFVFHRIARFALHRQRDKAEGDLSVLVVPVN